MSNENNSGGGGAIIFVIIIVLLIFVGLGSCGGGSGDTSARCGSCGRTFTDSSNIHSIAYKNMCKNCYGNYKWSQDALGN